MFGADMFHFDDFNECLLYGMHEPKMSFTPLCIYLEEVLVLWEEKERNELISHTHIHK
jgi:hypothetical protein